MMLEIIRNKSNPKQQINPIGHCACEALNKNFKKVVVLNLIINSHKSLLKNI